MPRQRRFSSRSVASSLRNTAISPARRASSSSVIETIAPSGATRAGTLRGLFAEIDIGPRALLRIFGIRRAHVEDRGQHRNERLADARQILKRQAAVVELPLLHALLEDARDETANAARRRLGERARS